MEPKASDVLSTIGYSHWDYSIDNTEQKNEISGHLYYFSRDKEGKWNKQHIAGVSYDTTLSKVSNFTIGVYQKANDVHVKVLGASAYRNTLKELNVDLSHLSGNSGLSTVDISKEIVLRANLNRHSRKWACFW